VRRVACHFFQPQPTEGMKVIRSDYRGKGPPREKMRAYLEMTMFDHDLITDELIDERYQASIDPAFMVQAPERPARQHSDRRTALENLEQIKARTLVVWGRENGV
jgi:2-hydroxy-6-oxonona-2,4-dienedioate hydrolase/4,5:9,10-diseco-3-hydroxy-5,9,17-trioxoandrosta-1(10),2-diene-4-oate hydrolase